MKTLILFFAICSFACEKVVLETSRPKMINQYDISYGSHSKNTFDIFMPDSGKAVPLVVFIHDGGFWTGDKSAAYTDPVFNAERIAFTDTGIAYASINYRLITIPSPGTPVSLDPLDITDCFVDMEQFLQFIRGHASDYNIDPNRIAIYGKSAGGCSAIWLNTTSTTADPYVCGGYNFPATLDIKHWPTIFNPYSITVDGIINNYGIENHILAMYGFSTKRLIHSRTGYIRMQEVNALHLADSTDADVWVEFSRTDVNPTTSDHLYHSPKHGVYLKDALLNKGITVQAYIPACSIADSANQTLVEYFTQKLLE